MSDAPERIAISQCGKTLVHDGMKRFETDVEYIRADHVEALLKAEREKALREAAACACYACGAQDDILALIEKE